MATVTPGKTFTSNEIVTPTNLNQLGVPTVSNIVTADLADASVTTAKIADANVTTAKIADANVTTAKIADGAVTLTKIASGAIPTAIPAGAIMPFAMNSAPSGWLAANGAAVSRTEYAELFSAIGTTHGAGNGSTTFNLPDLRGYFIRGFGTNGGDGTGSAAFGVKQADDFKAHTHGMANDTTNTGAVTANGPINLGGVFNVDNIKGTGSGTFITQSQSTGGIETRPRNIALLYCIKF